MKKIILSLLLFVPILLCADDVYYWTEKPKKNLRQDKSATASQPIKAVEATPTAQTVPVSPTDNGTPTITYVSERQDTVVMVIRR